MARGGRRSTTFKPGQVTNPRGRPKIVAEVKELARQYTVEALETLATIMRNTEAAPAARVAAASVILDRGYGKPGQHVEHGGSISLTNLIGESMGATKPEHQTIQ